MSERPAQPGASSPAGAEEGSPRVLFTGASGFVGSRLLHWLAVMGYSIFQKTCFLAEKPIPKKRKESRVMAETDRETYVKVKDGKGNEFVCPLSALKDVREATEEELDHCVDDATVGRYPGNIDVRHSQDID